MLVKQKSERGGKMRVQRSSRNSLLEETYELIMLGKAGYIQLPT